METFSVMAACKKIKVLNLSFNRLKNCLKLSEALVGLSSIRVLNCASNHLLSSFRLLTGSTQKLKEINLQNNKVSSFLIENNPLIKSPLFHIRKIDLSNNQISFFEGLHFCGKTLHDLNLSNNLMVSICLNKEMPNSLYGLRALRSLNMSLC